MLNELNDKNKKQERGKKVTGIRKSKASDIVK